MVNIWLIYGPYMVDIWLMGDLKGVHKWKYPK